VNGGDLKSFYQREGILVGPWVEGALNLDAPMHTLFPDPSEDPWYEVFVSMPLTWLVDSDTNKLKLACPLAVTCYRYGSEDKTQQICGRTKFVTPNPVYGAVQENLSIRLSSESSASPEFWAKDATRILVETPIVSWLLRAGPEMWNQAILSGDMVDAIESFDSRSQSERVPLTSVFMEFSPLDNTDWRHIGEADSDVQPLRALWLVSRAGRFGLCLFTQRVTVCDANLCYATEPFEYVFEEGSRAFWRRDPDKALFVKAEWSRLRDRAFWIALSMLRFLSPIAKTDPFPLEQRCRGDGTYVMTLPIRRAVARLMRATEANGDRHWYVPRDMVTNAPFFFAPAMPCVDVLQLESSVPWPQVDASNIRRLIAQQCDSAKT